MHENYPDTELIFDCDKNTNIPYRMANRELDVGITVYGEVRGISEFQYETLSQNTLSVMLGRTHRLWNKRPLYVEDLDGEKVYYIEGMASQTSMAVVQFYKQSKIKLGGMIPCRTEMELMLHLAKGDGVASSGLISNEIFFCMRDLIDVLPLERSNMDYGYIVVLYDEENALAKKFVEFLKEAW